MSSRYEPGETGEYGAGGIAREGYEERYATALWRDNPAAFWLHPEGPLADTAPAEYFIPRPPVEANPYAAAGMAHYGVAQRAYLNQLQASYAYQSGLNTAYRSANPLGLGGLLGLGFLGL